LISGKILDAVFIFVVLQVNRTESLKSDSALGGGAP
jgi:hypothetical protein